MKYYLGIDVGSQTCDAVIIDERQQVMASTVVPTGARNIEAIAAARQNVLDMSGVEESMIGAAVATGYGRNRVENRLAVVTEITCHARGIRHLLPDVRVLIDIGGQDSKTMVLDAQGRVIDFAMNDKCAAGTGRFLETMASVLQVDIDAMGELERGAMKNLVLSNTCTVFAESEVISLIAAGEAINEIVAGLNRAIASRTMSLIRRVAGKGELARLAMSGGVARNRGVVQAIGKAAHCTVFVPQDPDIVGALGAALIALDRKT